MAQINCANAPDRFQLASLLGVNPYSLAITANADGTTAVQVQDSALPDSLSAADLSEITALTGGQVTTNTP